MLRFGHVRQSMACKVLLPVVAAWTLASGCLAMADVTLNAQYSHEGADPLADDTGHGLTLTNGGGVPFNTPLSPGNLGFILGTKASQFSYNGSQYLGVPSGVYTPGTDFSFTALVRKSSTNETGHQTILASDRFRFQYRGPGGNQGVLRLDLVPSIGGTTNETPPGSFLYDKWYFVALTYNASTKQIAAYLNDTPEFTAPVFTRTASGNGLSDMSNFRLGNDGVSGIGAADPFAGQIDRSRFYQGVLSPQLLGSSFLDQTARYTHEGANPLDDDSGYGRTLTNGGGVSFVAPPGSTNFPVGSKVGQYTRSSNSYLDLPAGLHNPGDDFTFLALVRKNSDETGGHQTILGNNRFRFQWTNTGTTSDGQGQLHMGVNAGGPSGSSGAGTFLTDKWYFVAMTYNAASGKVDAYLQDDSNFFKVPAFSFTVSGGMNDMSSFRLGKDGLSGIGSPDEFGGYIDGARFFNRSFTRKELRDVFRMMNPAAGPGLIAEYTHEAANPLTDDTGHGLTLTNAGGVEFTAPPSPGNFQLGSVSGLYDRTGTDYLGVPSWYMAGDDFTFMAMVRKDALETGTHETILSSNRFRLQYQDTGTTSDGSGQLRLDVNSPGASGTGLSGAGTWATQQWYFVALTYDAGSKAIRAYLQGDQPIFGGPKLSLTANGDQGISDITQFRIGYDGLSGIGGGDGFGGYIDNIRFYDRKFTAAELRDVFRSYTSRPLGPFGLVSKYDFEQSNPLADDAPTGLHLDLTNGGGATFAPPPPSGFFNRLGTQAASFSGASNSYLDVPNMHTPGDDFTFVALVNPSNVGAFRTILSTDRFRFQFYPDGDGNPAGAVRLDVNGAGASGPGNSAANVVEPNQWYFVALRYTAASRLIDVFFQGANPDLTLNGPLFTRTALGASGIDDISRFRLGLDGVSGIGGVDPWVGWIDSVRLYDYALTNSQLQELFAYYASPEPSTVVLLLAGIAGVLAAARQKKTRCT